MKVAYLFPGQGAQRLGMGVDIAERHPAAAEVFERASAVLDLDVLALCRSGPEERLARTELTQPALLTASLACLAAAPWLPPADVMAGHSLGEYTALVAAGAIDLEDAVRLVRRRGELMHEAGAGRALAMVAVLGLPAVAVDELCAGGGPGGQCQVAAYNGERQSVVAGERDAVEDVARRAEELGARTNRLRVSSAFHTSLMTPVAPRLVADIHAAVTRVPAVPVVHNVTGRSSKHLDEVRHRLVDQLDRPVQWTGTMAMLRRSGIDTCIELGPGRVLSGFARRADRSVTVVAIDDVASLDAARGDARLVGPVGAAPTGAVRL
jgi:[acyl-carrier-protein] S-malonyltransferase